MSNKTVCEFKIKLRENNIYELYVNGNHVASKGSYLAIFDLAKECFEEYYVKSEN